MSAYDPFQDMTAMLANALEAIKSQASELTQSQKADSLTGHIAHFVQSVDWSETWIRCILGMHVFLLFFAIFCRRNSKIQLGIFVWGAMLIFLAETLNSWGGEYWEEFATQPYFDKHGVFFSTVVCGPVLLIMIVVLMNYLGSVVGLMIISKRKEFAQHARRKALGENKKGK